MNLSGNIGSLVVFVHVVIILGLSIRVILKRHPAGVSLAWLLLIYLVPFFGAILYLLVGERSPGRARAEHSKTFLRSYRERLLPQLQDSAVDATALGIEFQSLHRLAEGMLGLPTTADNRVQLLNDSEATLRSIIADVNRAQRSCDMEFYIWNEGGVANEVFEALIRAAKRGVVCRLLSDSVGSAKFIKSPWVSRFKDNNIQLFAALPVGPVRMLSLRPDVRLHRKIAVIDREIAYTGSLNLIDPRYFKQKAGVGQWVDAMVRVEGPAVQPLGEIFSGDWEMEAGDTTGQPREEGGLTRNSRPGTAMVQVIPSGPGPLGDAIYQLLQTAIYAAASELTMTTPYFVPDEAMVGALQSAARRGVAVTIILPEKIDSLLVRHACSSYFEDLLATGVQIFRFRKGLLHTKSVVVDGEVALFGTVNLDIRSFWLDYEVTLLVQDADFGQRLRTLQQSYMDESKPVDLREWRQRSARTRLVENTANLFAPLL